MIASTPEELLSMIAAAINGGDPEDVLQYWDEEGCFGLPDGGQVHGHAELRALYEQRLTLRPEITTRAAKVFEAFHEIHRKEYGHHFPDSAIEIVNLRLVGAASAATIAKPSAGTATSLEAAKVRTGPCTFRVDGKLGDYPTTFYRRDLLPVGEKVAGPAIVLQMDSTTVVPPQHSVEADAAGNLIVRRADA